MYKLLLPFMILLCVGIAQAQSLEYKVTAMGMNVADLQVEMKSDGIEVAVKNENKLSIFPHLDNYYAIDLDAEHRPLRYVRKIHQSELRDSVLTIYDPPRASMYQKSTGKHIEYEVDPQIRDFFSFIYHICKTENLEESYPLDCNSALWQARLSAAEEETVKTELGSFKARKLEVRVQPGPENNSTYYVDMLTHNFFSEDIIIYLWISESGFPLKAKLKKKLLSMNWEIQSIQL
ncbi:MAG: hypothetical protein PWP64_202 [Candidatus Cloacimonadota bacterium]|jgi:hypothetical protein|nr:hypothetical protein [Candidatus Cloacimonadota bacterium]